MIYIVFVLSIVNPAFERFPQFVALVTGEVRDKIVPCFDS